MAAGRGRRPRARDLAIIAAVWVTGLLKVVGALLALALVGVWSPRLPGLPVAVLGWGAAAVLTMYGGILVVGEALVAAGLVTPASPVDWKALVWHLYPGTCPSWCGAYSSAWQRGSSPRSGCDSGSPLRPAEGRADRHEVAAHEQHIAAS